MTDCCCAVFVLTLASRLYASLNVSKSVVAEEGGMMLDLEKRE